MFNLIVKSNIPLSSQSSGGSFTITSDRIFGRTDEDIIKSIIAIEGSSIVEDNLKMNNWPSEKDNEKWKQALSKLIKYDCMFMEERNETDKNFVRIGKILDYKILPKRFFLEITIDYIFYPKMPTLTHQYIESIEKQLSIGECELERNHWAVKDVDLFKVLLTDLSEKKNKPQLFDISSFKIGREKKISVMMSFDTDYDNVYLAIQEAAKETGYDCKRADDIWINHFIMQDIASLIDTSEIVICDCTGKNPNVFYEMGIAHTLGRESILITRNKDDIPFDISKIRYLTYLNNKEGLDNLKIELQKRITTLSKKIM